ncbi:hypothetical protein ARMGADRAFT_1076468 [Armillaria gallica]|uniref:Uncharacterized protein n=1 Tax=Armillaria gallica TaxID=47427 RepID=A0A2H3DXV2_ARMGA|nr:hypothetical protein ARMGADRAFT_1076468 [Armillaria gallica]
MCGFNSIPTPQTQQCTCAAPLNDHVAIVNPYRTPAALPYIVDFFAGGVQSNAGTPSNAVAVISPNIASLMLSPPPLVPSPSYQLYSPEPTIQAAIPGHYPDTNVGFHVDMANGHLYDQSNVTYSSAPDMNAGSYA